MERKLSLEKLALAAIVAGSITTAGHASAAVQTSALGSGSAVRAHLIDGVAALSNHDGKKHGEGKCGEEKCGEGKCGDEGDKSGEGKCGEGKCGDDKK